MSKTIINETLAINYTKKSNSVITGDQLGAELFASWKTALENCRREFYKYEVIKHREAAKGENATVNATDAFNALQAVLDLVGEVNGHPIIKNQAMLDVLSIKSVSDKEPLAGRALLVKSQIDNCKKRLEALDHNGTNPEAIEEAENRLAELEEEFKLAKKESGSCAPMHDRVSEGTFRKKFEKEFYATVIKEQEMKSWEELEAEAEARKAERKARAKARKAERKASAKARKAA